jgi:hypothetical protein
MTMVYFFICYKCLGEKTGDCKPPVAGPSLGLTRRRCGEFASDEQGAI